MRGVVSTDFLRVRMEPSLSGQIVGRLMRGDVVNVEAVANGWAQVRLLVDGWPGEQVGMAYIAAQYVQLDQPPPPQLARFPWGVNCLYSETAAAEALADGAQMVVLVESIAGAVNLARQYPDRYVVTRRALMHDALPDPADFVRLCGVASDWPGNVVIVGLNEDDQIAWRPNIARRFAWDAEVAKRIRAINPRVKYAASIYPAACNEPGEDGHRAEIARTYARAFNAGEMWVDLHAYGRDANTLWSTNTQGEPEWQWFEGRLKHLFDCGGFDLKSVAGRVIYSECGVDQGSVGGFAQLRFTDEQLTKWLHRFAEIHAPYQAVLAGAALFQYADSFDPPLGRGSDKWRGYEMRGYRAALRRVYQGAPLPPPPPPPRPEPEPPPPPPPAPAGVRLGLHLLDPAVDHSGAMALQAFARGCSHFTVMNDAHFALDLANLGVTVLYRWSVTRRETPAAFAEHAKRLMVGGKIHPNIIMLGHNEADVMGCWSADDMRDRAEFDLELAARIRDMGGRYAAVSFAMGNPDLSPAVAEVMRTHYAPAYNAGRLMIDYHSYSPEIDYLNGPGVGWYERRWVWLFTACGFDPAVRGIVSAETGEDRPWKPEVGWQGGGGFKAHGRTDAQVAKWCADFLRVQAQPIEVGGKRYASPFLFGTIFQLSASARWSPFDVTNYLPALKWS